MFVCCFGVGTSYFVVIGDLLPAVMQEFLPTHLKCSIWTDRHIWISIFAVLFIFPIVPFKESDALRFTSIIAVICFAYVTVIVVLFAANVLDSGITDRGQLSEFPPSGELIAFLRVIPIYIFAFTCHQYVYLYLISYIFSILYVVVTHNNSFDMVCVHRNSFTITNELKDNTFRRLNVVVLNSVGLCVIIYCVVGYSGYFSYGASVCGDILESYPQTPSVAVVRMVLAVALAWSYPLQSHPCRKCLTSLIWDTSPEKLGNKRFYILTYSIALSSFGISMIVTNLSVVLELVGSIGSPIISFILPGLFYYKMTDPKIRLQPGYEIKRKIAFAYVIFGSVIIPFTLSMQIYGLVQGGDDDDSGCGEELCK